MAVRSFYNVPRHSAEFLVTRTGISRALPLGMGVRRYRDLFAWQLADAFKAEIVRLLNENASASRRWRYRDQILESASAAPKDIAEGFVRYSPAQFARFLDYGMASLVEAEEWLLDGIQLKHFPEDDSQAALRLAKRCLTAMLRLKQSQERELRRRRQAQSPRRGRANRSARTKPKDTNQGG